MTAMYQNCPVREQAQQVSALGRDLTKALRRLRRSMKACRNCASAGECPIRISFNMQVDEVIDEIVQEWERLGDSSQ